VADIYSLATDPYPAVALIVGGLLALFLAAYGRRDDSHIDEIGTALAFILGIFMLVMTLIVIAEGSLGWFSLCVLILLATCLFLKPAKEVPWSGVFGIAAGAVAVYFASKAIHGDVLGLEEWKALLVVFFVVGAIVHMLTHFIEDVLAISTMVLSWKASMFVVGLVALAEGTILFLDKESLLSLF
jgi:hypothetical protein